MGRKLADLWVYAHRLGKRFKCNFCLKDFPGGIVRLRSHLSGVKGGGIQLCSKVSEEAKNDALSSLNVVNKKRKTGPSSSDSDGGSSDICDASEVGYFVAKFFEMADINYNMVESSSFTNLVNALSPGSTLPSSLELEKKLIPSVKKEIEQYVSAAKQSWTVTGCTLLPIFEPSEKEGRSFLSIFGCSREMVVLLYAFKVPTNIDSDVLFLQKAVHLVVEAVGSENIVQCVVDGSKYGESFSKLLCSKFPHVCLTNCAGREVQLMFEEICQDVEWVRTTFTIIKSIVDYICSDTTISAIMSKYTNGRELKQSLDLNLLSSYKMLESILEVKDHLVQLVRSPEWLASSYGVGQRGSEVTAYIEDPKIWELGEKLQKGLRSLSQVLCSVDFHDSSSGYLYGLMEIVEHSISQLWNSNQDMFQRFWDIYRLKKGKILSEFHIAAAFLNPAYMCTEQAKNADTSPVINNILGRFIDASDKEAFVKEVYEYMNIFSNRSKHFEITATKIYHPCQWWESCGKNLTLLRNLAIRILSQPCSTSTCKSSMCTVEAALVKEQRELALGITYMDLKMNAILMERFNKDKAYHERKKIVLEEFSKQISDNGESTSRPLTQLKLCFQTEIASPVRTSQYVLGENGCPIHVWLVDPTTGHVVQDGTLSTLPLTISVLDGHFSNEAFSEEHRTREYFNRNDLSREGPFMTGDLGVLLNRGKGKLGNFSFNYSSGDTKSGKFKLAVKTHTGDYGGFRILEGISNAFIVEDAAAEVSTEQPMVHVDPQNGSLSSNSGEEWLSNIDSWIQSEYNSHSEGFGDAYINDNTFSGFEESLAHTASGRVKKKALTWKLRSRGRGVTLKMGSQALGTKRRRKEVPELRGALYSSGSNNVNQQKDDDEVNGESVELFRVASSSGAKPVGETNEVALPTHPSTALQLSLTGDGVLEPHEVQLASANDVNQQEAGEPMALKGIDSTSVIARGSTSVKLESPAIMLFGVQVAGGAEPTRETHEGHSPTAQAMPTTEDSKEISYIGVRKRSLGRYDAEIQDPGNKSRVLVGTFDTAAAYDAAARQFLGLYAKTNFPIASEPEIDSTGRGNQISNKDGTPQEVEENQYVGDNYKSENSVKFIDTHCGTGIIQVKPRAATYDVFLSFRGVDTRRSFTDILYQYMIDARIQAFVDRPATLSGDSIEQEVISAIDSSKICVCIFSRTYASSAWCLRELERMMQKNKNVIPVFYGVTRDDVQLKTSMYTDDLAMHETKYDKEQVQQWREALINVAKLKVFELENISSLLDTINELIGLISSKLMVKPKYEIQHFIGVEDHINNALSLLDIESRDKRILGIHGMAGVGKTTLAKCIFNMVSDKFDMSYFLESSLETKEMEMIKESHGMKILVVLDDMGHFYDKGEHITDLIDTNWFGSGSRIIVTTRNEQCLENMKNVLCYNVVGMDAERALKLFSEKAFGLDSPPEDYQDLSKEVVSFCNGLPLALTMVGSFLHDQERPYWEQVITDMQKGGQSPPDEPVIPIMSGQDSSLEESQVLCSEAASLCKGQPLVQKLMSSLLNDIGKQFWQSKIHKVIKVPKAFQKMMTECRKTNEITGALGEMFRDMIDWGTSRDKLKLIRS